MNLRNVGHPEDRRGRGEVVGHELPRPAAEVTEDEENVYVTAEFLDGEPEVTVEPTRVTFRGGPNPLVVDLPAPVVVERAVRSWRNGVADLALPKLAPPA